jgi:Clp amino terminal domain, pathogenicity island component
MPPLNLNLQDLIQQIETDLAESDELAKVTEARQRANLLASAGDQLIDHFVDRARKSGASWSQIGGALGVTKQAAQQRWTPAVFSQFTARARQAVVNAQEKARSLRHAEIQPEHVILGLLSVQRGAAAEVMVKLAGSAQVIEDRITASLPPGTEPSPPHIPFTPESKEALKQALDQALELGHNYIGTEHLLLGLLQVPEGRGARLLTDLGIDYQAARAEVLVWITNETAKRPDSA